MDLCENSLQYLRQCGQRPDGLLGKARRMRFREYPQMIRRKGGMRNERHKLRVLSDDPARLLALLRNEGAGQALAAIGKEPAGPFDPFDDLARNDRDADNLRMRMLLRRAGVYAVILEDDYMPYARVPVKLQEPMPVGLQIRCTCATGYNAMVTSCRGLSISTS